MAVLVACMCGKRLKVPDEFIGRNIRCPACKAVVLATPSGVANTPAPEPSPTILHPGMVHFYCGLCGKEMQALAEYGGQETICPGCSAPVTIPEKRVAPDLPLALPELVGPPPLPPSRGESGAPSSRRFRAARRKRRARRWVGVILGLLLLIGGGFATWFFFVRDATPPDLALVPLDAQGFVTLRVADVWNSDTARRFRNSLPDGPLTRLKEQEAQLGLAFTDCERATVVFKDVENEVVWFIVYTAKPFERKKILDTFLPGGTELTYQNHTYHALDAPEAKSAIYFHSDRIFVFGPKPGVFACLDHLVARKTEGPLKAARKEAAGKRHLVAGFVPSARLLDKVRKDLVPEDRKAEALLDFPTLLATGDFTSSLQLETSLTYPDGAKASAARDAAEVLKNHVLDQFVKQKKLPNDKSGSPSRRDLFDQLEAILTSARIEQKKETLIVQFKAELSSEALRALVALPEVERGSAAMARLVGEGSSAANLRILGTALTLYEKNTGRYPPAATVDPKGRPLLSWRVHLLPYLGEVDLYREFHLNESWDSPHNFNLLKRMPAVYRMPEQSPTTLQTYYKVFVGREAPFDQARQLTPADIKDGLGHTIAIAEAATPVEWTRPDDIPFRANAVEFAATVGRLNAPTFNVLLFDGHIVNYPRTLDPKKLQALVTHNGGETILP